LSEAIGHDVESNELVDPTAAEDAGVVVCVVADGGLAWRDGELRLVEDNVKAMVWENRQGSGLG
jgi:hypothetical protein